MNTIIRNALGTIVRDAIKGAGVWLAARGLLISDDQQTAIVEITLAVVVWLIGFVLSMVTRRRDQKNPDPAMLARTEKFYRHFQNNALLVLLIPMLAMVGCYSSPVSDAYQLRATFNDGVEEVLALNKAGTIPPPLLQSINVAARVTEPLLDEADRAALAGDNFKFDAAYRSASRGVEEFLRWLARARNRV